MSFPLRRRLRSAAAGFLLRALGRVLKRTSWRSVQRWGRRLGDLAWRVARRDRRRSLTHLALAFPDLPETDHRRIARACFRHLGTNVTELLHLRGRPDREVLEHVQVEGWERIEALGEKGKPLLVLTGHCGNWELLGPVFRALGVPLSAVVRAPDEPRLQRLLDDLRRGFGTHTIERGSPGAVRELLTALREGRALMMLIDQDTRVEGARVPFFGHPANTPVGAARLALKRGAAVVPAFMEREGDGRHSARFLPPLDLPPDPTEATAVMTAAIERQIRRRPEQWVWMHRRWRRGREPAA